jgi:hypothetical protein
VNWLLVLWGAWLALPVVLAVAAVAARHTGPIRGLAIAASAVSANLAFHLIVLSMADAFAFVFLPFLTFLVLLSALWMLSLSDGEPLDR